MKRHGFKGQGRQLTVRTGRAPLGPARSVAAPPRVASSRARACQAGWAATTAITTQNLKVHPSHRQPRTVCCLIKRRHSWTATVGSIVDPALRSKHALARGEVAMAVTRRLTTLSVLDRDGKTDGETIELPAAHVRRGAQHCAHAPGGRRPSWLRQAPGHALDTKTRAEVKSAVVARSRTARRAPAAPVRAPSACAAVRRRWHQSTARSRVTTSPEDPEEDEGCRSCVAPSPTGPAAAASSRHPVAGRPARRPRPRPPSRRLTLDQRGPLGPGRCRPARRDHLEEPA